MVKKKHEIVRPEDLVLSGGNVVVASRPDGSVAMTITGSLDPLFTEAEAGELSEWLDDHFLGIDLPAAAEAVVPVDSTEPVKAEA
jgi:hypothetical protein